MTTSPTQRCYVDGAKGHDTPKSRAHLHYQGGISPLLAPPEGDSFLGSATSRQSRAERVIKRCHFGYSHCSSVEEQFDAISEFFCLIKANIVKVSFVHLYDNICYSKLLFARGKRAWHTQKQSTSPLWRRNFTLARSRLSRGDSLAHVMARKTLPFDLSRRCRSVLSNSKRVNSAVDRLVGLLV